MVQRKVTFGLNAAAGITGRDDGAMYRFAQRLQLQPEVDRAKVYGSPGFRPGYRKMYTVHDLAELWAASKWLEAGVPWDRILESWMPAFRRLRTRTNQVSYEGLWIVRAWKPANRYRGEIEERMVAGGGGPGRPCWYDPRRHMQYVYLDFTEFVRALTKRRGWVKPRPEVFRLESAGAAREQAQRT